MWNYICYINYEQIENYIYYLTRKKNLILSNKPKIVMCWLKKKEKKNCNSKLWNALEFTREYGFISHKKYIIYI